MKWFLVVYLFTADAWFTAEQLGHDGWHRNQYPDAESCIIAQHQFTDRYPDIDLMRASCEQH